MLAPLDGVQINALLDQLPQGTQLTQEVYPLPHRLQHVVDLAICRESPNAKPDTAVSCLIAGSQSPEHVAGL